MEHAISTKRITKNPLYLKYLPRLLVVTGNWTPRPPFTYQHMPRTSENLCGPLLDLFQGPQSEVNPIGIKPDRFRQSLGALSKQLALWDHAFEERIGLFIQNGKNIRDDQKEALGLHYSDERMGLYLGHCAVQAKPDSLDVLRIMGDTDPSPIKLYAFIAAALNLYAGKREDIGDLYVMAREDLYTKAKPHRKSPRQLDGSFPVSPETRRIKKGILDKEILKITPYVQTVCGTYRQDLERIAGTYVRPESAGTKQASIVPDVA